MHTDYSIRALHLFISFEVWGTSESESGYITPCPPDPIKYMSAWFDCMNSKLKDG